MAGTYTEWVRTRSDDELVMLLRARPDLGTPSPSTLRSLAARAASRTSLERALARADAATLQVLESLLALNDGEGRSTGPVDAGRIAAAIGAPEASAAVGHLLRAARAAALVWDEGDALHPAPGLDEVLGPYPAGLGPAHVPARGDRQASPALAPDLQSRSPAERAVLDALAWGPPVGVVPPAGSTPRAAVDGLVHDGLLLRSDARHVLLPRDVGLALRDGRTHRDPVLEPPRPAGREIPRRSAEAEAATAALEIVRAVGVLVTAWDDVPPPLLRAGGLGVRDLRRTAHLLESDEQTAAFVVEIAASAGLVADDGDAPASYVPTTRADAWEQSDDATNWAALVLAWLRSRRTPWQVGSRDEKGAVRAPLSPDLHRPWVPRLRSEVLEVLAGRPGVALDIDELMEVLRWRTPRSVPPQSAVAGLLREAALLGVTGAGTPWMTSPPWSASVLEPSTGSVGADSVGVVLADGLRDILPAEVDEVLLQGDLTGIVPGRPSRDLARLLEQSADVESRGAALTVRFTVASVTRALDHGRSGEDLVAELARRSPVPVPQPLEYLVKDTARRHEALRVGSASAYVRAADPTVLAGLAEDPRLASLGLVRLAPTVLAAAVPPAELHEVLRERGLLSALEGPDGRPLGRLRRPRRLDRDSWPRRTTSTSVVTDDTRAALVAQLRRGSAASSGPDDAAPAVPEAAARPVASDVRSGHGHRASEPGDSLALLHEAIRDGRTVTIELVGASGTLERRDLRPLRLDGGRLRALDPDREAELTIAVHRIAAVEST